MKDDEFPEPFTLNIPGRPIPTWVVQTPRGISYFEDGESAYDFWIITKTRYGNQSQS